MEIKEYDKEFFTPLRDKIRKERISSGKEWRQICGMDDEDYQEIEAYIRAERPKLIVEYGSGESTFFINNLLDELDYGGRIISFEDNEYYFNLIKEYGLDEKGSVNLVPVETGFEEVCTGARYIHSYEGLEEVDFVILDGPDIGKLGVNTTFNLLDMWKKFNKFIPYFIDGRKGTKLFYKHHETHLF